MFRSSKFYSLFTERYHIKEIGLYVSYINESFNEGSDIYLLIRVPIKYKSYLDYLEIKDFIENRLGKRVDLVYADNLNLLIKNHILRDIIYI